MREISAVSESTWAILKSPWLRPTLIIGCVFALFQQIVGINAIIFYAPHLGLSGINAIPTNKMTEGTTAKPSIHLHPSISEKAKLTR